MTPKLATYLLKMASYTNFMMHSGAPWMVPSPALGSRSFDSVGVHMRDFRMWEQHGRQRKKLFRILLLSF